jgi:predicted ATPase
MKPILEEIHVENFKSFKNTTIRLNNFNVVVGPNASGKSNLVDFFRFLKKAIGEQLDPYAPYLEWWSYKNIVWGGREELPIKITLKFDVGGYKIIYYVAFAKEDVFRVLEERLEIPGYTKIERKGNLITIVNNPKIVQEIKEKFFEQVASMIKGVLPQLTKSDVHNMLDSLEEPQEIVTKRTIEKPLLTLPLFAGFFTISEELVALTPLPVIIEGVLREDLSLRILLLTFLTHMKEPKMTGLVYPSAVTEMFENQSLARRDILGHWCRSIISLKPISIDIVKTPRYMYEASSGRLSDNAENFILILYDLYRKSGGSLPERLNLALREFFPGIQIGFDQTRDGKIFLKVYQYGYELDPPCIPDGLYKTLLIFTAVELKPPLLIIDEIENSLHAKILQYVIDELKNSESTVIITTHSPIVIDMVDPEDLLMVEMTPEGSVFKRVREPEEARRRLKELGITQSEAWLYGQLEK